MNIKILIVSLLIWNISSLEAQACPTRSRNPMDYIRRDGNRCEGIIRRKLGGSLNFVSLAIRGINTLGDTLTLQIPNTTNSSSPNVLVRTTESPLYRLDELKLTRQDGFYSFSLPTRILKQIPINVDQLRVIARTPPNSPLVYTPVIIGRSTTLYEIVFHTPDHARFNTLQISGNGQTFRLNSSNTFQSGDIVFSWDGRRASAGRYELYYEADIEQRNKPPERVSRRLVFEHNPNWLR